MTRRGAPPSLAARVVGAVLTILLVGGVLVSASTWLNGRQAARQAYDRVLLGAAQDIAESIRVLDGAPFVDLPVSAFELLAQAPDDRIYYAVRGPRGGLVTGLYDAPVDGDDRPPGVDPVYFDGALQGEAARFVQVTRRFAERSFSGAVTVTVGQTTHARQAMALDLMLDALVPMIAAGVALMVMSYFVLRSAVAPLLALSDGLARRDPYDLTPMQTEGLPRELQVMIDAMNRFMGRLDRQVEAMRNLISDTAHQLRTPVAAIRVQAESIQESDDTTASAKAMERLLARTRSLGRLLDQLLSRALVIHRTDSAPRVALDLREVALDMIDRRDHELLAPGVEVTLEIGEEPVRVMADDFSVGQATKNLLFNALKHGAPPVAIGTEVRGSEAAIWVQDAGPGPDPAVSARLGQRFERSTASQEDSAGLGLSIVAAVATALGGRVEMGPRDGGFRIALVLPLAPETTK
ncbi:sensor histidine kinase [Mesobacterium pallidum]|uniref:sensor histidine kinase n=1 Tax=Mesobacterium pallidum TaxID=2872037 RepID=UPI001EE2BAB8|nr:sensor histidine kinase [Mesobacterium pallidum]